MSGAMDTGAHGGACEAGAAMRWDWRPGDGALRCGGTADAALARLAAGVTTFDAWMARVAEHDRDRLAAGLRACAERAGGHWRTAYAMRAQQGESLEVVHEVFTVGAGGGPVQLVGSVTAAAAPAHGLAGILDLSADAIIVCDMSQRVLYCNRAAAVRYGWQPAELIGRPLREHIFRDTPEHEFAKAVRTLMRLGDFAGRMTHTHRTGDAVAMHERWALVRNDQGVPCLILSISTGLRERAELDERLVQAQKLESLGTLAGGIAHDFNNLLTVIIGNAEELVEALQGHDELVELAWMIQTAGRRGARQTQRLLAFARSQALEPELIDVGAVLDAIEPMLRRSLPGNIGLHIDVDREACRVFVDRGQFEASVLNLCINARDAMPDGGALAIHATMSTVGPETAAFVGLPAGGDYIVVTVSDDGVGIPVDVQSMVFDPFFTTKRGGSGLGLSMVDGFARQSRGHVTISSEPGCGTVVTLYLPCAAGTPGVPVLPAPACQRFVHSVLLVEDDPGLRAHVRMLLEALGNTATAAANGEEALTLLKSGLHFDVLLTDIMMPGMNGTDLAHAARSLRPGLRILLSSGYLMESLGGAARLPPGTRLLQKPYGKAELRGALDYD